MNRILSVSILACLLAFAALAQTPTPAPSAAPATSPVTLQVPKLPAMFGAYGQFNQLGSPRFNGGIVAIYPVSQSVGIYGSTITDLFPSAQKDTTTGRTFYALNTSVRQGFHKDMLDTGAFSFFIGGDIGPSFSSNTGAVVSGGVATISVSLSTSATGTLIYKAAPWMDVLASGRMLYVSGAGWNPVVAVGILFNLKKLPPATK
jgi:hypothetical protein